MTPIFIDSDVKLVRGTYLQVAQLKTSNLVVTIYCAETHMVWDSAFNAWMDTGFDYFDSTANKRLPTKISFGYGGGPTVPPSKSLAPFYSISGKRMLGFLV
jgi:hypothetical protein